jgi:hypothetical protein
MDNGIARGVHRERIERLIWQNSKGKAGGWIVTRGREG